MVEKRNIPVLKNFPQTTFEMKNATAKNNWGFVYNLIKPINYHWSNASLDVLTAIRFAKIIIP